VRADGYDNYLPLITTSLNSKPETIIMKYEERFSIEITYFIQYLRLYIHDKSFKDTLDGLSIYLLSKRPPKAAALMEAALKEAYVNIGYGGVNKVNDCLIEAILTSR
jgi:hypothetical protein